VIPRVTATVDAAALRHNMRHIRALTKGARVMAVIKADAYGHGSIPVARALRDLRADGGDVGRGQRQDWEADAFAVACLEEAMALRGARIYAPLVVLEGVLSLEEARLCLREQIEIVIHDHWQLAVLEQLPRGAECRLWVKIDTGMNRLGFSPAEARQVQQRLALRPEWQLRGWMTHLARADDDSAASAEQARSFDLATAGLPGERSIANSAGVAAWPALHRDWVRPGLMLYGASPLPGRTGADLGLRPAMKLESRILSLRDCKVGDSVGYGGGYRCPRDMRIAVVTVGYADGLHRCLPPGTPFVLHGTQVPMVGRVSMDMITVDVSQVPQAEVGDAVLLWGPGLPAEALAGHAGTIAYELFCGLTRRVRFQHIDSEAG
jgi:alanine racemase